MGEPIMFTITFGPPDDRQTEHPRDIKCATNRYRELSAAKALDIVVCRDGQLIDPGLLLAVSPPNGRILGP
jgi:hypothetical protein